MVLNIGSRRGKDASTTPPVDPVELEQPAEAPELPVAEAEAEQPPKPRRRTSTRTRKKPEEAQAEEPVAEALPASEELLPEATPDAIAEAPEMEPVAEAPALEGQAAEAGDLTPAEDRPRRSRSRGGRGRRGGAGRFDEARAAGAEEEAPRETAEEASPASLQGTAPELRPIIRAIEQQSRQVERLTRVTEDLAGRVDRPRPGASGGPAAPAARVGVFVDTANIELATDRLRARFDWGKIMKLLLRDRQLVRAVAYSPIHDDPAVSIETQRFVEPFLDRGFKIVTKPFRRFQDGSIKANLDIELALDVVAMLDRLDVVILVSGDGDFQRLVEMAQGKGVRVEVASVGLSTASNLRHAADEFIDLGARVGQIRA